MSNLIEDACGSWILRALCPLALVWALPASAWAQPAEPKSEQTPRAELAIGDGGTIHFGGLMQGWFLGSLDDREPYAHLGDVRSSFRLRRTELAAKLRIGRWADAVLMIDPAQVLEFGAEQIDVAAPDDPGSVVGTAEVLQPRTRAALLQDAYLTFHVVPYADVSLGQGKTPLSLEGLWSSSKLLFAERAEVARRFGDHRDIGLWVHHRFDYLSYHLGIYNGAGQNRLDGDSNKDLAGRIEAYPWDGLVIGASFQRTLSGQEPGARTIVGGDTRLEVSGLTVQGELYWGEERPEAGGRQRSMGSYGAVAYAIDIEPVAIQPAVRWDWFDPDTDTSDDDFSRLTAGVNLLADAHRTKLQLNYVHTQAQQADASGALADANNDLFILVGQVAF